MNNVDCTALNMDVTVFNIALEKLENEGYITGLKTYEADSDRFYCVSVDGVKLTRDGIEYVEKYFGIQKEITAEDKLKYIVNKCGVLGMQAMKLFGMDILKALSDII